MGKIGWGELVVILILALVVLGPEKLPQAGKALGKALRSVKKYVHEATEELENMDDLKDIKKDVEDIQKDVQSIGKSFEQSVNNDVSKAEKRMKAEEAEIKAAVEKMPETEKSPVQPDAQEAPEAPEAAGTPESPEADAPEDAESRAAEKTEKAVNEADTIKQEATDNG